MKDPIHHKKQVMRKVIQSSKKAALAEPEKHELKEIPEVLHVKIPVKIKGFAHRKWPQRFH